MASFAKAQLLKYGWTEGKGLGKNENGIVDPLKPKLKFDTTGIGHDDKEHKWWESVYNKAASNVDVSTSSKKVSVTVKDEDAVEISTRKLDLRKLKKNHSLEYGSFLKTCTLDNGKVVPEENLAAVKLEEVLHEAPSFELTDEQLFQACGGRTAHKGARHGLTLSGKLARIAQQEAEMLASLNSPKPSSQLSAEWTEVKKKKKLERKRRRSATEMDLEIAIPNDSSEIDANANNVVVPKPSTFQFATPEERKKSKTARRRERRRVQDLVQKLNSVVIVDESTESANKTIEKKKIKQEQQETPKESKKMRKMKGLKEKYEWEMARINDLKRKMIDVKEDHLVQQFNSVVIVDESKESENKTIEEKKIKQEQQEIPKESKKTRKMKLLKSLTEEKCPLEGLEKIEREKASETDSKRKIEDNEEIEENHNKNCKKVKSCVEDCGVIFLPNGVFVSYGEDKTPHRRSKKFQKSLTEADRLNHRIEKKKKKRQAKSEQQRVEKLSECLMAFNLCEDSVDSGRGEDLIESCEASKKLKKWKKNKKEKKDKKIEVITLEP